jgi:hypothetical protein
MQDKARAPSSALRPSQASAAELVAGGAHISIPAKQPLGEFTQDPVKEYALSAGPAEIDADLTSQGWRPAGSLHNHLVFEHVPTGIRMHDVHAGNFIRQKNGILIPIDVFFEGLPPPV